MKMKVGLLLKVPRSIDRTFLIWLESGIHIDFSWPIRA